MTKVQVISKTGRLGETHSLNIIGGSKKPDVCRFVLSQLVSKCDQSKIPDIYTTENMKAEEVQVQMVVWFPLFDGQWAITEVSKEDPDLCFGYASVLNGCGELGYFRFSDIAEYASACGISPVVEDYTRGKGDTLAGIREEIEFIEEVA